MANPHLLETLRKLLALTTSPVEGEAQAAAFKLQELLTKHNLEVADLETRGAKKPGIEREGFDLGKAAFTWKLNLAETMADHYFCYALVNRYAKTVQYIGRPDNVKAMTMLYGWVIDQIKAISAEERKKHQQETGEHIDPLRWQVNFGLGAVSRLGQRLEQIRRDMAASTTALAISHQAEISDYLEEQYGYRTDGRKTKQHEEWEKRWEKRWKEQQEADEALLRDDPDAYYAKYPHRTPEAQEAQRKADEKRWNRRRASARGRAYREETPEEERKRWQGEKANRAGNHAADRVNLQPFLKPGADSLK
jgi:hypothetical protein